VTARSSVPPPHGDLAARQHLEHLACFIACDDLSLRFNCSSACATVTSPRDSRSVTSPRVGSGVYRRVPVDFDERQLAADLVQPFLDGR
jgi:hypothetical protein